MDHRCLYGHRIPETFTFAIQQRSCPTCGAPSVTVEGYQLARQLTEHVRLEAMAAFNSVRFIEERYNLSAARVEAAGAASAAPISADDVEVADDELSAEVDAADLPLDILDGLPAASAPAAPARAAAAAFSVANSAPAEPDDETAAPSAPLTAKAAVAKPADKAPDKAPDKTPDKTADKAALKLAKADSLPTGPAAPSEAAPGSDAATAKDKERFDDLDDEFFRETV